MSPHEATWTTSSQWSTTSHCSVMRVAQGHPASPQVATWTTVQWNGQQSVIVQSYVSPRTAQFVQVLLCAGHPSQWSTTSHGSVMRVPQALPASPPAATLTTVQSLFSHACPPGPPSEPTCCYVQDVPVSGQQPVIVQSCLSPLDRTVAWSTPINCSIMCSLHRCRTVQWSG